MRRRYAGVARGALAVVLLACTSSTPSMRPTDLQDFGTRYAAAWSGQQPDALAAFYADNGVLQVNDGKPSVGRDAVRATIASFMEAFPDMHVRLDSLVPKGDTVQFHWTWTGTNTGPGGTGKAVHMVGYEAWTFAPDGKIAQSLGHYDDAEYQRQLKDGVPPGR